MSQDDWLGRDADVVRGMDIDRRRKERRGGPDYIQRRIARGRETGRGGGGRGRPPTSTAFPRDDDEDPERSFLMAAIQEILDYDGWSSVRKIREIEKLIGRTRPGRR